MGTFNTGPAPVGILERALVENVFVEKNLAYMNEGDKDGYTVYKHDIKNVLRARSVNPASSVANTSVKHAIHRQLVMLESFETFNPADYHNHWLEFQPTGEFDWEGLPTEVQATLENLFLGSSVEASEEQLTNGDGTLVLGLIPQLEDGSLGDLNGATPTPTQVVNNTAICFRAHAGGSGSRLSVPITADNVFSIFELLIQNQSKSMRKRTGRKFMVNNTTADLFQAANRAQAFKGVEVHEDGTLKYGGLEIIVNQSMEDDKIVLASMSGDMKSDAFQLGTSMSSDFNNLTVERIGPFAREWGMLLSIALDIYVVRPEEVCIYTDATVI